MIQVNRSRKDEHGCLIRPSKDWRKRAANATRLAVAAAVAHQIDDVLYKAETVRAALEKLFNYKCAYCESPLEETDWDVEHFRPKGGVAENPSHPGYFWLAYTWNNLYPSCKPCNQRRKDKPTWERPTYGGTGGKAIQFPLKDERRRIHRVGAKNFSKEGNLLLDPCRDNPEQFLAYDSTGGVAGADNKARTTRAEATIRIFFLDRERLKEKRRVAIKEVVGAMQLCADAEKKGQRSQARALRKFIEEVMLGPRRSHLGACRAVLKDPAKFGVL